MNLQSIRDTSNHPVDGNDRSPNKQGLTFPWVRARLLHRRRNERYAFT